MNQIFVDFSKITGTIKPMHAVNNGPVKSNLEAFREAGIPCCRNHDAAFSVSYGGSHAHDVLNIFPDFDADENDPANYDFTLTDVTVRDIYASGSTMMYRLGSKIEHEIKKYQTFPPKDFAKYARICEHIILHYCYGWADGMQMPIKYWEIWNEADNYAPVTGHNPCWQGTHAQFCEFYEVMAKYLKGRFPELKIGGPAYTGGHWDLTEEFLCYAQAHEIPIDFFSWHCYCTEPSQMGESIRRSKSLLVKYGYGNVETVLDEWNYVRAWSGPDKAYSYRCIQNEKGLAFNAANMLAAQKSPLDMLMYYDARMSTAWNGLFAAYSAVVLKPYYAFWQFGRLYQLKNEAASESDEDCLYVGAAVDGGEGAVQIAYYSDAPQEARTVEVTLAGLSGKNRIEIRLSDKEHDNDVIQTLTTNGTELTLSLCLQQYSSVLISACVE